MTANPHVPTPKVAVLGHPIAHSKSPVLHTAAYKTLGLEITYEACEVSEDGLDEFLTARVAERAGAGSSEVAEAAEQIDWLGFSVTMPHKGAMVGHMDHLSDRVQRLGFLNTVVFDAQGTATGYNTDVDGIVKALEFAGFRGAQNRGGTVGVLGAGGTAAAAIEAAHVLGLTHVDLLVRNPVKAAPQRRLAEDLGLQARTVPLEQLADIAHGYRAVVSTLPPGAADKFAPTIARGNTALPPLLDVAYDPWPSALAQAWQTTGGQVVSGLEMLLYQAVEQVRLFTARIPERPEIIDWDAVIAAMAAAIGLPSRLGGPPDFA